MSKLMLSCVLLCLMHMTWSQGYRGSPSEFDIFSFRAPEERIQPRRTAAAQQQAAPSKIRQQVIFIKSPEPRVHRPAVQNVPAPSATEFQTHIYVLSKEPRRSAPKAPQAQQQSVQQINHKPEVKFLTYRQPGEAERLQAQIIQQYGGNPNSVQSLN